MKYTEKMPGFFKSQAYLCLTVLAFFLAGKPIVSVAQEPINSQLAQFHILLEGDGFIPLNQSYRINYESKLLGLPVELAAGVDFPITPTLATELIVRYRRREALFLSEVVISSIEAEPGVRVYLERDRPHDFRLFGTAGLLLVRSTVSGKYDATTDGTTLEKRTASKDYYNIGIGLGLGLEYPITTVSTVFAGFHIGVYVANPARTGGLGNAGGLSIGLGYKIAIL